MKLTPESADLSDYLTETEVVDFSHPLIQACVGDLKTSSLSEEGKVRESFHFVRDEIHHSWDIQSRRITCKASDVLRHQEGICYAKAHLLAALLRAQDIPTGFCYQKITLGETPDTGYCLHGLNAVWLSSHHRWIRLDPRGNKPGVQAEFSTEKEQLAFPIRPHYDETDYPTIFPHPHPAAVQVLQKQNDCLEMYRKHLPVQL